MNEHALSDQPEQEGEAATGPAVIKAFVRHLPARPGVYRMFSASGDVLYVGKARHLKNRVASYTRFGGHTNRIAAMISRTASMEFVTTATEAEALLLEANLIKRLKPHYNVILRDDKSFPYILISRDHAVARIVKHRGARSKKGEYFGPFASAGAVNRTLNALQKAFGVRSCSDNVYDNRTRPCLLYQIKRCAAPCTGEISLAGHDQLVRSVEQFLAGKSGAVKSELAGQMEQAAEQLDFERAAVYRDRISALSHVTSEQGINPQTVTEADVFGICQEGGQCCIQVFFIRAGQNWGNRAYFPRADKSFGEAEILASFLTQFYDDRPIPKRLLLPVMVSEKDLLEDAFSTRAGRKVVVSAPRRGEKKMLVGHAQSNAREALGRRLVETRSQTALLAGMAKVFGLDGMPQRIEIYDNSHIQGASAVGAMVVAGPDGFAKNHYRKFNIKDTDIEPGDDYAMMREVLTRRFARLLKEHGPRPAPVCDAGEPASEETARDLSAGELPAWPDLVLIDGGAGQLEVVREVFGELGIMDQPVAGIAKGPDRDAGRERIHMAGRASFMLEARDPVLYFIQRLRDEAHRFAIGSHRARRAKALTGNPLDDIEGIGPGRKKALLRAFGSAREVARASISDLGSVDGISQKLARVIHGHFQEGSR